MTASVVAGLVAALAVLVWPSAGRHGRAGQVLRTGPAADDSPEGGLAGAAAELWRADPADLLRRWRARRRRREVDADLVPLLEAIAPGLAAGLTPAAAAETASSAMGGSVGVETALLVAALGEAARRGEPVAPVWQACSTRTGSPGIGFVASAWRLSESTGAPLAEAVARAVGALRDGQERERRVGVATAGPRATVAVLTALPLTGPLFGLACGVPPGELYLSNPVGAVSAGVGVALIVLGRWWCGRLVAAATAAETGTKESPPRRPGRSR